MERHPQSEDWCNCGAYTLDWLIWMEDHLDNAEMKTLLALWYRWMRKGTDGVDMNEERASQEILALLDSYYRVRIEGQSPYEDAFARVMALAKEAAEELSE
jgi:hypothetical protein